MTSLSGEQYYLVEVIAYVLKYLKQRLRDRLKRAAPSLRIADIHWVITVPAIWKQDGKQMMREAAYKVTRLTIYRNQYREPAPPPSHQSLTVSDSREEGLATYTQFSCKHYQGSW